MCVDVASYTILTSEVALVHLPVFTESCVWDAFFSIIKFFYLCLLLFNRKENHKANLQ